VFLQQNCQSAGLGYSMVPSKMPSLKFEEASGIKSVREIIPEIAPSSRLGDLKAAGEVLGEIKTGISTELGKPSLQAQKLPLEENRYLNHWEKN